MGAFEDRRASRPYPCCREAANCTPFAPGGQAGAGVLARAGERCTVCGRRHFGVVLAPGRHGVTPGEIGGRDGAAV